MSSIEICAFQNVTVPDIDNVQQSIQGTLNGFDQIVKLVTQGQIIQTSDEVIQTCIEKILNEGKIFCKLTRESASGSERIAHYCLDIISYVETLTNEKITGEEFLEVLDGLLSNANKCKSEAVSLKNGYTQIYNNLNEISEDLTEYEDHLQSAIAKEINDSNNMSEEKKEAKTLKWMSIAAGAGLTALTPFTGGLSAIGVPFTAQWASENATKEKEYRVSRDQARATVLKLNGIRCSARDIITQTNSIIDIIDHFQVFWDKRVDEIQLLTTEFEEKKTKHLKYNKLSASPVIKKWGKFCDRYTSYSTNVRSLLNNAEVDGRIAISN
ncbi:2384_t:CDS:1 [Ambispora gerdemannii]|uniref:2384_t:CDS:1 n=1 Tax=Ambispora gerdemannii TaxID=144530 RepID=A0A9N8YY87_9GLOM|nr:2384_t:CDS:1 [Ambispora gerdemannii]